MTIGQTISKVVDKLTPGHHTTPGSNTTTPGATTGATDYNTTNTQTQGYQSTYATSSNSPAGTMEQAGAGEYQTGFTGGHNPANAGAVGGGIGAGVTGGHTTTGETVCVRGNVAAPVPVGEKTFTVTEDHAVQKEKVERWVEHQPVEREFKTTVEETGRVAAGSAQVEGAVAGERTVGEHTCYPTNTTTVTGVAGHDNSGGIDGNRNTPY